jgi:large subunit ribosomal protein L13
MTKSGSQDSFFGTSATVARRWYRVDATGQILGRLAVRLARVLQGKHKPEYTPSQDVGDFVVVENAHKIAVSGDKMETKEYQFFSGYPGGQRRESLKQLLARKPEEAIRLAVRRMLPKSRLGRKMLGKLKIHKELPKHGYAAQKLEALGAR